MSVASTVEEMVLELMVKGTIDQKSLGPRVEILQRELAGNARLQDTLHELVAIITEDPEDSSHAYTRALALLETIRNTTSADERDNLTTVPTAITYDRDAEPAVVASMQTEIEEKCDAMEHDLLLLERSPDSTDTVLEILGHLHSIKGVAGFMEVTAVMKLAHVAESALTVHADSAVSGNVSSALFRVVDMFRTLVDTVADHARRGSRRNLRLPPTYNILFKDLLKLHDLPDGESRLDVLTASQSLSASVAMNASSALRASVGAEPLGTEMTASSRAAAMFNSSAIKLRQEADDDLYEEFQANLDLKTDSSDDIFGNLVMIDEAPDTPTADSAAQQPNLVPEKQLVDLGGQVRVPMARLDELGEMVSETVIAYTQLMNAPEIQRILNMDLERKLSRVSNALRSLQATSMSLRLFPFSTVLTPLRRAARDVADKQGKELNFQCIGEETELDKGVLQDLSDPLIHLIRNAIDHGLESADDRKKAGKPKAGSLMLQVESRRGKVIVTISDDGRGLNRDAILKKAASMDLIESGQKLSDTEVWDLIFEPGFSTAETVSEISGRGVGMDVVKRRVERLNGTIAVHSEAGVGTQVTLTLPLTLAMFDGLLVAIGSQTYIVPQSAVGEVIRPRASQVDTVHQRGVMLSLRGKSMPLVRLQDYVGMAADKTHPSDATLLIAKNPEATYALMVDAVIGRQPVVLRNISEALPNYHGVSGCAILGDGSLGLVLDMDEIYSHVNVSAREINAAS